MKPATLTLAGLLALLLPCVAALAQPAPAAQPIPYVNAELGFSMTFPAGWEVVKNPSANTAVQAAGPAVDNFFRGNANVVVEDLPTAMSLDEYYKASLTTIRTLFGNSLIIVKETDTTIAGLPAKGLTYRLKMGEMPEVLVVCTIFVRGKQGFTLTCMAGVQNFDRYRAQFKTIFDSFKLQTPTQTGKKSAKQGFDITFPADWEIKDNGQERTYGGYRPLKDGAGFRENVTVMTDTFDTVVSLDDASKAFRDYMKQLPEYTELKTGDRTINNVPAKYVIFTYHFRTMKLQAMAVILVKGNIIYQLSCGATPQTFPRYQKVFEQIVDTFVITE